MPDEMDEPEKKAQSQDKDSILQKRVSDVLRELNVEMFRRELHLPDALKRDITVPEVLKKEIPVGEILSKEIHIRRKRETIEQFPCPTCGRATPNTVAHCLHCEAPLNKGDDIPALDLFMRTAEAVPEEELAPIHLEDIDNDGLVDLDW